MIILNGKEFSTKFRNGLTEKVNKLKSEYGVTPGLAVVLIGTDPASEIYDRNKNKAWDSVGVNSFTVRFEETATQQEVEQAVKELASRSDVDGLFVQMPIPKKFDTDAILKHIPAVKDVDGLCAENLGKL